MTVRRAKYLDIPRIVELLRDGHKRSRYNGTKAGVDIQCMKSLLMTSIQKHDSRGEGATHVLVSENDGVVEGIIIGVACRIQESLDMLYVSDLVFYQSEKASPADAILLMQGVVNWANGMTKVFEITVGATDVIGDYERTAKLFQRMGMHQTGVLYTMEVSA